MLSQLLNCFFHCNNGYAFGKCRHKGDLLTVIVTNGCEIVGESRYYIDRENNVYNYLAEIDSAVESEHTFACDDNGEQIPFVAALAKRISVIAMEEAVEKLASVHQ